MTVTFCPKWQMTVIVKPKKCNTYTPRSIQAKLLQSKTKRNYICWLIHDWKDKFNKFGEGGVGRGMGRTNFNMFFREGAMGDNLGELLIQEPQSHYHCFRN